MDGENAENPHVDPFRQLLQSVARDFTNEDLASLKFLCESHIPKGKLEKVLRPLDLCSVLIEQGLITGNKKDFLVSILDQIGRQDLSKRLLNEDFVVKTRSNSTQNYGGIVNREAQTKDREDEVNRKTATKEMENVETRGQSVDRQADTKEPDGPTGTVRRDADTVEDTSNNEVNRESETKENEGEEPTRIIFRYSTPSSDLLKGLPKHVLQRNVNESVLFGRGVGIEENGVFLNDTTASRRHLQLYAQHVGNSQSDFMFEVLGKPVQIQNQTVHKGSGRQRLNNNDELKVGQLKFRIQIVPGNSVDLYEVEFASASKQATNGTSDSSAPLPGNSVSSMSAPLQGQPAIVNYSNYVQVPTCGPLPNLVPVQGLQFLPQQGQGPYIAGAPNVPGIYPYVAPGYAPPMSQPNMMQAPNSPTVPPGQPQLLYQFPVEQRQISGGLVAMGGGMVHQVSIPPNGFVAGQQDSNVKQSHTAQERRDAYQLQMPEKATL